MDGFGMVLITVMSILLITSPSKKDLVKKHMKEPICLQAEVGHETIKKCYIVKEVQ